MSDGFYGPAITPGANEPLVIIERGRDQRLGPTVTYEWKGRKAEIDAMEVTQFNLGRKTSVRRGDDERQWFLHAVAGVEESTALDVPLSVKWSLKKNLVEKNLWEHPSVQAAFDSIMPVGFDGTTFKDIARMKRDFEAFIRGDDKTTTESGSEVDLTNDVLAAHIIFLQLQNHQNVFINFLKARFRGVEAFPQFSWVLRKTTTIYDGSSVRPNKDNVGRLFSAQGLKNKEGLDDKHVLGELPTGYWLKVPVDVDGAERGKSDQSQFEQEYWHAETFDQFVYPDTPIES